MTCSGTYECNQTASHICQAGICVCPISSGKWYIASGSFINKLIFFYFYSCAENEIFSALESTCCKLIFIQK